MNHRKKLAAGLLGLLAGGALFAAPFGEPAEPRVVQTDLSRQLTLAENGRVRCEIVIPDAASPTAKFAAGELKKYLSESIGANVPIVKKPDGKRVAILVGTGADVSKLPRDGYVIQADGNRIVIAGRDDPRWSPNGKLPWGGHFERATLFGVYDFLERFLGAKFVFPGEAGTVVPKHATLKIPAVKIMERPDNIVRSISWYQGKWPEGIKSLSFLNNCRLRMSTDYIPNCHGLGRMAYIERFGKTHPEYFALSSNGTRSNRLSERMGGQLCFSSKITEEIYLDAKAWLTGQSAKSRNMRHRRWNYAALWDCNAVVPGFFNIMPQDGMRACQCADCKKLAVNKNWMSDQVWKLTCDTALRLKKAGVKGYVTQMAYGGHKEIPPFDVPDNVLVMTAVFGPWSAAKPGGREPSLRYIQAWCDKIHGKTWLWTYVCKYAGTDIPDVPCSTPEAVGKFYADVRKNIFGSFMESESDYAAFQFFNWYVFAKKMWNAGTDTEKLLTETYSALYGAGAPPMTKFFRRLETLWLTKICGRVVMTATGPASVPPTAHELWNDIYSAQELGSLNAMLAAAEKAAAPDPAARKRIAFIRTNYYGILKRGYDKFYETQRLLGSRKTPVELVPDGTVTIDGVPSEAVWKKSSVLAPGGLGGAPTEVATTVRVLRDSVNLYISCDCAEPDMADGFLAKLGFDSPEHWRNDSVEIFLNPEGKRAGYFQWMISRDGAFADLQKTVKNGVGALDMKWNSGAKVKTVSGKKSWTMEMAVPLKSLGKINPAGIVANFTRSRVRKSKTSGTVYHSWRPFARNYGDVENFMLLAFQTEKDENLLRDSDFQVERKGRFFGRWFTHTEFVLPKKDYVNLDEKCFLFGGKSMRIANPEGKDISVCQYMKLKKGVKYRVSFAVKTDIQNPGTGGVFVQFYDGANISWPRPAIRNSVPWTFYRTEFVARQDSVPGKMGYIRLYNYHCKGTARFDAVRVEPVK